MSIEGIGCYDDDDDDFSAASVFSSDKVLFGKWEITLEKLHEFGAVERIFYGMAPQRGFIRLAGGSLGGSVSGKTDTKGKTAIKGEGHVSREGKDGGKVSAEMSVVAERNKEGKFSGEVKAEVKYELSF